MSFSNLIQVRISDYHLNALRRISSYMNLDISSIIRLCIDDGIETFCRWSDKNISEIIFFSKPPAEKDPA